MEYKELVKKLIENYQSDFPLVDRPYAFIAKELGVDEEEIMSTLTTMKNEDLIGRVGSIYPTHKVGYSFLAACSCPDSQINEVSEYINSFQEVNHNYERENDLNLWFVVTAKDEEKALNVCRQIEAKTELKVYRFPMVKSYKIDLTMKQKIDWELM